MRELIKYGLLGLGAYLLAREVGIIGGGLPEDTIPAPGLGPTREPASEQRTPRPAERASEPNDTDTSRLAAQLEAAAGGRPQDYDHWAWYYRQLTGQPAPAPEDVGVVRTDPMPTMSAAEWVALVFGSAPTQTSGRSASSTAREAAGGYGR